MAILPVAIVVAVVLWACYAPLSIISSAALLVLLGTTLVLRQVSNNLQLIRVRSWAVSAIFIFLIGICAPMHLWNPIAAGACLIYLVHVIGMLTSYQSERPQNSTLLAFVSLAVLTMVQPKLVYLLPFSIFAMAGPLRTLSDKSLVAVVFGFLLPYELWAAWQAYEGTLLESLCGYGQQLIDFQLPPFITALPQITADVNQMAATATSHPFPLPQWLSWWPELQGFFDTVHYIGLWLGMAAGLILSKSTLLLIFLGIYGIIALFHFLRTSYNDKISTRMHYHTLLLEWPVLLLLLIFTPDPIVAEPLTEATLLTSSSLSMASVPVISTAFILCISPILAHYFVFSKVWGHNILFWFFILLCLFLTLPVL